MIVTNIVKMAPFKALYGRKFRTPLCLSDLDEVLIIGPELIRETTKRIRKIREHIRVAQSRRKSYVDKRIRPLEFQVGDKFSESFSNLGYRDIWTTRQIEPKIYWAI